MGVSSWSVPARCGRRRGRRAGFRHEIRAAAFPSPFSGVSPR
ncbi:hypothetical protein SCATT_44130 [Streptantibioticus cattleyicolor NRRL 8057 = DSM 46488]|uniref:Uncharacterized protein n=1 Tax=Streptantibioticus cattleyicolor (strain ATCC 35852 / DSM 46488 / JCM 4925 / NBRC 14057 / NRRL 8057) TaxID=1003195 RepID=G8WV21_STREN|nr:hypothetical protein SCATT_44130 [Streptantibioticus cattleyicolor NRRL 8057 = DSM 46488]